MHFTRDLQDIHLTLFNLKLPMHFRTDNVNKDFIVFSECKEENM